MGLRNRDWAKKYIEYMMSEDYEAGFDLKQQHFPKSFFKYRKLTAQTIENIENKQIWLSKIGSLNDPFESSIQFDNDASLRLYFASDVFQKGFETKFGFALTARELDQIINSNQPYSTYLKVCGLKNIVFNDSPEKQLSKAQRRGAEIIDEINEHNRICCFSERNDSLLMWSHYADEHKGICIEYDLGSNDEIRPFLSPIAYSDTIYKIKTFDDLTPLQQIGAMLTKCKDWEYEEEWRYTPIKAFDKDLDEKVNVPIPKAVYFGPRFLQNELELKSRLIKVLDEQKIPIHLMKKHPTEYKLIKAD